jgi:hypothetical protein
MSLVRLPSAFVLVPICVVLDTETVLFVVKPVADVLVGADPFVWLLGTVFIERLLFDPVNVGMRSVLLGFTIVGFPDEIYIVLSVSNLGFGNRALLHFCNLFFLNFILYSIYICFLIVYI